MTARKTTALLCLALQAFAAAACVLTVDEPGEPTAGVGLDVEGLRPWPGAPAAPPPLVQVSYDARRDGVGGLAGTEVQGLIVHEGAVFAATTKWMETNASVWPASSAQVLVSRRDGVWTQGPALPESCSCQNGARGCWEQVNSLETSAYIPSLAGARSSQLFVSTMPNEDNACVDPRGNALQGTVFSLDGRGTSWRDTGLGQVLSAYYGSVQSEVRYVRAHADGSASCGPGQECLFAFVNPRGFPKGAAYPTVWRGIRDPARCPNTQICWDSTPEAVFDGVSLPVAKRLVAAHSAGPDALLVGTNVVGMVSYPRLRALCTEFPPTLGCPRASLVQREAAGRWVVRWQAPALSAEEEVRGISSWKLGGTRTFYWVTNGPGNVRSYDGSTYRLEASLRSLQQAAGVTCSWVLPYQIYLHKTAPIDPNPALLIASETCDGNSARLFYRRMTGTTQWTMAPMASFKDPAGDGVNEAAVRWILTSPFRSDHLLLGTTDMNSSPGQETAKVLRFSATPAALQ